MNKKIVSIIIFVSLFYFTGFALAQTSITNPLGDTTTFAGLLTDKIIPGITTLIASLSVIMIIIAGIFYLTSAGSPEKVGNAKKALISAIIGIAIAVAAETIATIIKTTLGVT